MKRVIMIDDDTSILSIFKLVFERAGYSISIFNNPSLILQNNFEEPDIFIIDKQLGSADGADICHFLKTRKPERNTPVIIFSASTHIDKYAKDAGADDFLEKPFKSKDLLALVEKHTGIVAA